MREVTPAGSMSRGARKRDALLLPTGQMRGLRCSRPFIRTWPSQDNAWACRLFHGPSVAANTFSRSGHVRKQRGGSEDESCPAAVGGEVNASLGVQPIVVADAEPGPLLPAAIRRWSSASSTFPSLKDQRGQALHLPHTQFARKARLGACARCRLPTPASDGRRMVRAARRTWPQDRGHQSGTVHVEGLHAVVNRDGDGLRLTRDAPSHHQHHQTGPRCAPLWGKEDAGQARGN